MSFLSSFYPQPVVAGTTEGTFAEGNDARIVGAIQEAPENATPYARKDGDWTPTVGLEEDGSISAIVQVRQGTAVELGEIVLNDGELAIEIEGGVPKQLKVGDGTTAGGVAPSINDWTIVEGTAENNQEVTNSNTFVDIGFFSNAATLQANSFYEFFGKMTFLIGEGSETNGGIKMDANGLAAELFGIVSGDWNDFFIRILTYSSVENIDVGSISFQGFAKIGSSDETFIFRFAQQVANDGFVRFLGSQSYLGYRKIA